MILPIGEHNFSFRSKSKPFSHIANASSPPPLFFSNTFWTTVKKNTEVQKYFMNMKKYISISYMFRPIQGPSFIFSGDLFGLPTYAYNLCSLYSGPYIISQLWLWLWRQLRFWSQCLVKNVQRTVKCSAGQTFVVQLVLIFPGFVVMWAHFATGNNWARQNRFVFIR